MTASVTELRAWKPDHVGEDPWVRATRLNRAAIASQTPRSPWADRGDDDGPEAA